MNQVTIEISARHVHLTEEDWEHLFGAHQITEDRKLAEEHTFVAVERLQLLGPSGELKNVAIVGPWRSETQVEVSLTDARILGIQPPVSVSGNLNNAAELTLVGPNGSLTKSAAIISQRHLHIAPTQAKQLGLQNGQCISITIPGLRGGRLDQVVVRFGSPTRASLHLDTDEGNAFHIRTGMIVELVT